jgi:alpha-glucoside transport system permease protein
MGGNGSGCGTSEAGSAVLAARSTAPGFNTFCLVVIFIWAQAGFAMVIFSAAIRASPTADRGRQGRRRHQPPGVLQGHAAVHPLDLVTVTTLTMIAGLKAFDIVAATPARRFGTSTIANEFYVTKVSGPQRGLRLRFRRADLRW